MAFNVKGARAEGYSDAEIAEHLASEKKFNVKGARTDGYSDTEIVDFLTTFEPEPSTFEKVKTFAVQAKDNIIGAVVDPFGKGSEPEQPVASAMVDADNVASGTLRAAGPADPAQAANTAMQAEARKFVPVTIKPGQELEWLGQNNPDALNRLRASTGKQAAGADIAQGAASIDRGMASQNAENVAAAEAEKANPHTANLKSGLYSAAGGLYGAMAATAANLSPYGEEGYSAKKLLELSNQQKDWGKAIQSEASKQNFRDADSKMAWMADQFLLNAPSTGVTLASIFSPATAPYALGAMAAYSGGGHYTDLVNAGVDNGTATLAALGYGVVEAAIERAIPIEIGQEVLRRFKALAPLKQAQLGQRVARGVAAGTAAGTGMAVVEGGEEAVTGIIQRSIDQAVKQDALNKGQTDVAGKVGQEGVYDLDQIINDTMGGIAGGAPVAGAVGAVGGRDAARSAEGMVGEVLLQDVDSRGFIPSTPLGDGPGEAEYRAATQQAFGGRVQTIKAEVDARKAKLRGELGIQHPAVGALDDIIAGQTQTPADEINQDDLLNEIGGNDGLLDGATHADMADPRGAVQAGDLGAGAGNAAPAVDGGNVLGGTAGTPVGRVGEDQLSGTAGGETSAVDESLPKLVDDEGRVVGIKHADRRAFMQKHGNDAAQALISAQLDGESVTLDQVLERGQEAKAKRDAEREHAFSEEGKAESDAIHLARAKAKQDEDNSNFAAAGGASITPGIYQYSGMGDDALTFTVRSGKNGLIIVNDADGTVSGGVHEGNADQGAVAFANQVKRGDITAKENNAPTTEQVAPKAGQAQGAQGLSIGSTPNNAEPVTVRNGVVHVGEYPAMHFESGEDVTVPAGADNAAIAQALRDAGVLSSRQRIYGLPKAAKPAKPGAQPASPAAEIKKARAKRAAKSIKTADELSAQSRKTFLQAIKDIGGIKSADAADVSGEPAHIANRMAPGLFRKEGNAIDLIARRLNELGYLSDADYNDVDGGSQAARDLIGQALSGEAVMTPAEQERYNELVAKEQELAEGMPATDEAMVDVVEAEATEDDGLDLDALPIMSEADAMRAMGFSEEEINGTVNTQDSASQAAEGTTAGAPQEGAAAGAGQEGQAATDGEGVAANGERAQREFSLASESEREIAEREAEVARREDEVSKLEQEAAQKAKADSARDSFVLSGSDRASDANPGQADIFSQPKPAETQNASTGAAHVSPPETADAAQAYTPPSTTKEASARWAYGTERGANQNALFAAVSKAMDAKLFYNREVDAFVAKELGVTDEQRKVGADEVEGGAFGYDVFHARKAVEKERADKANTEAGKRLGLKVGENIGKIKLNDGKVASAATVEEAGATHTTFIAKRGPQTIRTTIPNTSIEGYAEDAGNTYLKDKQVTPAARLAQAGPVDEGLFAATPGKLDAAAASIDTELDAALKELADALKKQSGSLNSGVDPAILALGVKVGSLYVAKGVVKFAQYSKAIIDALRAHGVSPDQIKPYLKQFYAATKQSVDDATFEKMDDDRTVRSFDLDALASEQDQSADPAPQAEPKLKTTVVDLRENTVNTQDYTPDVEKIVGDKLETNLPEIEYVTGKGKTITGVIAKTLTKEQAGSVDKFTWKKDGGYFIRMKHVVRPDVSGSHTADAEPAAAAEPKPAGIRVLVNSDSRSAYEGEADFNDGKPRVLPSYYTSKTSQNAKDWYRGWDKANAAAPVADKADAEVETKQPNTLDELVGAVDAGYKAHFDYAGVDGRTVWIEQTANGAWVMKSRDDGSTSTGTKGGAGPKGGWDKLDALKEVERDAEYRFTEWKPLVEKPAKSATNKDQGGVQDAADRVSEEGVPAGRAGENQEQRADGGRVGEPLDAGLAGSGAEPAGKRGVSGGVRAPAESGEGRTGVSDGQQPPGAHGDRGNGRTGNGAASNQLDHTISDEDGLGEGGLTAKYRDNIAAIKIIKTLEADGRVATPDERKALARYVGWGALKGVFDPNSKTWAKQHKELRELLTDAEFDAARASIRNAHYTSPVVIKSMYGAIDRLGFKGGRILEPSMGSGNFFGLMPAAMRNKSKLHGVELDSLTSRLARALYPNAVIATATGFQEYQVPQGYFDMAYGNPPFGSEPIVDRERNEYSGFSIHNYFIARMIDKTRDGGIVPVIVSHSFMDALSPKAREWIAKRANLLGAVRLPETAFKNNAGTEVVTDILFFQKTATPEKKPGWINSSDVSLVNPKTGEGAKVAVNDYFSANPANVLGKESLGGTMYTPNSYTVEPTGDLAKQLQVFVESLPENVYQPIEHAPEELATADNTVPDGVKPGSYYLDGKGAVRQRGNDVAGMKVSRAWEVPNAGTEKRMRAMIQLRDLLRRQMRDELNNDQASSVIETNRAELNTVYDAFVKAHGYLNSQVNRRIFLDDTESALVQALEFDYDAGITKAKAEASGLEEKKPSATKADILKRRVLFPPSTEIKVSNAQDALLASLNAKGRVDMGYMATAYDKTAAEIAEELGDLLFEDPQAGQVTADEYLSGDVKTKLIEAKSAAAEDARFERNVKALEKVIPVDKMPSEIFASIGANWIPNDVYQQFAEDITGSKNVKTSYLAATAQWFANMEGGGDAGKLSSDYGTDRINSFEIFKLMLNGRAVEVKKRITVDGKEKSVTDEAATEAARQRLDKIKQHWDSWVWNDGPRAERLTGIYNEKHNRTVERGFDGSHMTMPGMSPMLTLRRHQKNVIWRATQVRNVLMDHVVGAGKTFAMVGTIMEMKRLGIARKPLFVVPNHLTLQWRSDFSRMYPAANVLAATPEDFSKDNRERMFAKIATGEYDAVVVGHSSLKKIGLNPEIEQRFLKEQLDEIADAINGIKNERGDKNIIRDMEKIKANLEAKIESIVQKAGARDKVVTFDELGIDALFIDEMHEFKNLFFYTQKQRVSGLGNPKGSGKAFDLFMKVRWMQDAIGDNAPLITATGTPVSNSLSEMFTMQRYMRFNELKRDGLHLFDAWSRMYGEDEYVYEVAPSGVGYRISQRFSKFKNLPSLMGHYQSFADVVTLQDLKDQAAAEGKRFPVPKMVGGRQQNIVAKRSGLQRDFFGVPMVRRDDAGRIVFEIDDPATASIEANPSSKAENTAIVLRVKRAGSEAVTYYPTHEDAALALAEKAMTPVLDLDQNSLVGQFNNLRELTRKTKGKINALSLTGLASKAGLDYRLINPTAPDFAGSKINIAVAEMVEVHKQWAADRGTQLVFCDLSVPLSAKAAAAKNEKRLYVLGDDGTLTHKKGTLHTVEGFEGFPFYLVRSGKGSNASVAAYEPISGQLLASGLADKAAGKEWAAKQLATEAGRDKWFDVRDRVEAITPERIIEYRDDKELEVDEDGSNEISMDDLEAMSGAGAFSVYDDIKAKLVAQGVPEGQIAFIHDYHTPKQKEALFKRVNAGDIRILMGSTPKLGAGTNVQERLVGLHHIDAPWRPSDLEQREGRIIRQGNKLYERDPEGFEVFIGRYATEQTYDTRRWQLLEHKAAGIEQLRKYSGENEIEDVAGEAANAADMKAAASGNPLILEETKLRTDVKRLTALRRAHEDGKYAMQNRIKHLRNMVNTYLPKQIADIDAMKQKASKYPEPTEKGAIPEIVVDGKKAKDRKDAEALVGSLFTRARAGGMFGNGGTILYRGVPFEVSGGEGKVLMLESPISHIGSWSPTDLVSPSGVMTRMANVIDRLDALKQKEQADLERAKQDMASIESRINGPFEGAADLAGATAQHAVIQRRLMKSTQMDAVQPGERAELTKELEVRKQRLIELGYGKAVKEALRDDDGAPQFSRGDAPRASREAVYTDPDASPEEIASVRALNRELSKYFGSDKYGAVLFKGRRAAVPRAITEAFRAAFGRRVVFVQPKPGTPNLFNGFQVSGSGDLYVNGENNVGFVQIAGHELWHHIQRTRPDLIEWYRQQSRQYHKDLPEYRDRLNTLLEPGEKAYTDSTAESELEADFLGDSLADPVFLQQLADSSPDKFKQFMTKVRLWLAGVAQKLRGLGSEQHITDVRALQKHLGEVLKAYADGKPIASIQSGPEFSRGSVGLGSKVWRMLAGDDAIYQNPLPDSFDMERAAKEIDPGMSAVADKPDLDEQKTGIAKKWYVTMPDGTHAYVLENKQGEVWLDASRLEEGSSGGTKLYLLVGSYAEGNGKVFIGDPAGLSDVALIRRTENMLSLALRFGKTDFLRPHEYQMNPEAKLNTVLADVVRPLEWVEGDSAGNIDELLRTSYANTLNLFPEVKDVSYNFDKQRFERDGAEFTDFNGIVKRGIGAIRQRGLAKILSSRKPGTAGGEAEDFAPIGSATLKRAAVLNTVARAARGGRGGELLAEIGRVLPGGLKGTPLAGILYSRSQPPTSPTQPQQTPPPGGVSASVPEETRARRAQRIVQDQFNRFTVIQEWLRDNGVNLTGKHDVYRAEERMHGKIAGQIEDFRETRLQPLIVRIHKAGFNMQQVGEYLVANHAAERNAQIAKINTGAVDHAGKSNGSGMTDAEAQDVLDRYTALPNFARFEAMAEEFRAITSDTQRILLDAGIISKEMADAWNGAYQHYVPLRGGPDEPGMGDASGKGVSVNARGERRRAMGHQARDEWAVENIIHAHERAIYLAEKNRVGQYLVSLAAAVPDSRLWTIDKPVKRKVLKHGQATFVVEHQGIAVGSFDTRKEADLFVTAMVTSANKTPSNFTVTRTVGDPQVAYMASGSLADNEVQIYVKGNTVRIQLNDPLLARAYKKMGQTHLVGILEVGRTVNAFLSKAYTGLNPEFIVSNVQRDLISGVVNITGEEGAGIAGKALKNWLPSLRDMLRYSMTGKASVWVQMYREDGGNTGAAYLSDLERVGKSVQAAYDEAVGVRQLFRESKPGKATKVVFRKSLHLVTGWIEHLNAAAENGMRVALYRSMVEAGRGRAAAAAAAKNSTVNFNRKGEIGAQLSALYLFANPAIQGSASMGHALFKGKHKGQAWALMGTMAGLAYMLALAYGDDDEWDEVPQHEKDRNMLIRVGDKVAKIAVPYGHGIAFALGNAIYDLQRGKDTTEAAYHMASSILENIAPLNPLGDEPDLKFAVVELAPFEPFRIFARVGNNTSGFQRQIMPDPKFDESQPDFLKAYRNTHGSVYDQITRGMSKATGGTITQAGAIDVSPETLKFLFESATGGTGRFFMDSVQASRLAMQGSLPELQETPIVRKFVRNANRVSDSRARFWESVKQAETVLNNFRRAKNGVDINAVGRFEGMQLTGLSSAVETYKDVSGQARDAVAAIKAMEGKTAAEKRLMIFEVERAERELYRRMVKDINQRIGE